MGRGVLRRLLKLAPIVALVLLLVAGGAFAATKLFVSSKPTLTFYPSPTTPVVNCTTSPQIPGLASPEHAAPVANRGSSASASQTIVLTVVLANSQCVSGFKQITLVLQMRIGASLGTVCEIVTRPVVINHRTTWTRTHYCRSQVNRGSWSTGNVKGLPRWAIVTSQINKVQVVLTLARMSNSKPMAGLPLVVTFAGGAPTKRLVLKTNSKGQAVFPFSYGPRRVITAIYPGTPQYSQVQSQAQGTFPVESIQHTPTRILTPGMSITSYGTLLAPPRGMTHDVATVELLRQIGKQWVVAATARHQGVSWQVSYRVPAGMSPRELTFRPLIIPTGNYPYLPGYGLIFHAYVVRPLRHP